MENRKNLCAMIPADLHARVREEQDKMELTGQSQKDFVIGLIEQALSAAQTAPPAAETDEPTGEDGAENE